MNQVNKITPHPSVQEAQPQAHVSQGITKDTPPYAVPVRKDYTKLSPEWEASTGIGSKAASPPSPIEQLWMEQESTQKSYDEMKKSRTKVSLQLISQSFGSLAAARTKSQVQSVIAETQRNITSLRFSSLYGEDADERRKAQAALASMQKLLQRGGHKIHRLNEEDMARLRQKRAKHLQDEHKVLLLSLERKHLRTKRLSADGAIKKEGELEELNQSMRFHRLGRYDSYDTASPPSEIYAGLPAIAAAPYVGGALDDAALPPDSGVSPASLDS